MPKLDDLIEFSGEDNVYEVEKIVGVHRQPGKPPLYRVRWKGYGPEEDTYEPRDHLLTCEDMIDDYLLEEEKKQEEAASKREKKKSVKRRHSGESASPSVSPTETKVRDVGPNKEDVGSDEVQMTPSIYSNDNAHFQEDEDPDDVDRRALLKDPFWNDLENGVIVPNLFETDMYSKVKSRRATLEAKRKQKEEETDDQRSSSLNESQSSEKSSPGGASKKNQSLSQDAGETKRHKKKKYSNKHDPGKKKKKKKDHKSKKKHRQVKMDLEAIGSLESATQKSLKMSPSDLDGSDNSANLFISRIPAEEVLTVAKLEEQSRQSSSNGSQSSDGSEECDQAAKSKDTKASKPKQDSLRMLESSRPGHSPGMGFLSPDLEQMLEKNPFSLNEDTDSETLTTPLSTKTLSHSDQSANPSVSKEGAFSNFEPIPSTWDPFAKDLASPPPSTAAASVTSVVRANSPIHNVNKVVKKEPVDIIPDSSVKAKQEVVDPPVGSEMEIIKTEPKSPSLGEDVEISSQLIPANCETAGASLPIVKTEPVELADKVTSSLQKERLSCENNEKNGDTTAASSSVTKQESLDIPDSIEDHLTSVEPVLETVLKSQSLGNMEELPNLTGNLFDNFLPANSPFTDDEQRNSGSEEPKIDVGQLLSSLEDKDISNKETATKTKNSSTLSGIEASKEISEKEIDATREGETEKEEEITEARDTEPLESEMRPCEVKSPTEASSLVWPWSGSGPVTSPSEDITKDGTVEQAGGENAKSQETKESVDSSQVVPGDRVRGSDEGGKVSDVVQKSPDASPRSHVTSKNKKDEISTKLASQKNICKTVSKVAENTDSTESGNGHEGNNLFDSLKSCVMKEKSKEKLGKLKSNTFAASKDVSKPSNLEEMAHVKGNVKLTGFPKDKQQHVKTTNLESKQPKKFSVVEKNKEVSKSKNVTKNGRKDEEKNNNVKIPQKGTEKLQGSKDQDTSRKKQLHEKSEEKKKKKISGGSWKFDSINEIPRNDENKVPMELIDKNLTLDEDYLCKAITEGDLHLVQAILQHCPNLQVDSPNSRGQRPLVLACMGGQNEILKKLILSRASVDVRLQNGVTPLMIAAELGYTCTAGILLEAGAFVNLANTSGETALIKASRKGHVDVVQLLLHYGADWGQTSQENTSALSLAKQHKMYLVSDLLQKHEQRMVEQLEYGITQYMWETARLVHSVLPSRCFRIRESTQHHIKFNFDPTKIPFSPTLGTMLFLCHVSPGPSGMSCHLSGPCHVKGVTLNGVPTSPVPEGNGFVMEFLPKTGVNILDITTHPDPYSKMLLLVAAYSLQLIQS